MYTVFVKALEIKGIHGATEKEMCRVQPFQIDISVDVDTLLPKNDRIEEAFDYRLLKKIAQKVVEEERHVLVETIARRIAEEIKADPRVTSVTVSVAKPAIWPSGTPGVTVKI